MKHQPKGRQHAHAEIIKHRNRDSGMLVELQKSLCEQGIHGCILPLGWLLSANGECAYLTWSLMQYSRATPPPMYKAAVLLAGTCTISALALYVSEISLESR